MLPREAIEDEPSSNALPKPILPRGQFSRLYNCEAGWGMPQPALRFRPRLTRSSGTGYWKRQPYGLACLTAWARRCGCPPGCCSHCGSSFRLGLQIPRRIERA